MTTVYALEKPENKLSPVATASKVIEPDGIKEHIDFKYEITSDSFIIKFDKIGSYSVYQTKTEKYNPLKIKDTKGIVKTNARELMTLTSKNEKYLLLNNCILGDEIKIDGLFPGTQYTFYIFSGQEVNEYNLLKKISFITIPQTPELNIKNISSEKVEFTWDKVNNADEYEIFKNGKTIKKVDGSKTYFIDQAIQSGKKCYYQIRSVIRDKNNKIYSKTSKKRYIDIPSSLPLPNVSGECKTWANYQAVTLKSSPQYKLLHSEKCYTDKKTGIRMVDDCYCVALGSYYGSKIGQKYLIKLSSGKSFKAILCDQKANRHTDPTNRYALQNKDIIEFYIDRAYKPAVVDGSYNVLSQFNGAVISIEKI